MKKSCLLFLLSLLIASCDAGSPTQTIFSSSNNQFSTSKNENNLTQIEGFEKNNDVFTKNVDNNQLFFSFIDRVTVPNDYYWKLFTDFECRTEIISKTVQLNNEGDNIFYLLVLNERETFGFYQVNIYRYHLYTVTFDTNGGTSIPSQIIQEQSLVNPVSNPSKAGYTFNGWNYDFTVPVTSNLTISALWSSNHYFITLNPNGGNVTQQTIEVIYNEPIILPMPSYYGHNFLGWFLNNQLFDPERYSLTSNITLIAKWNAKTYAINLSQPSSLTSFTITYNVTNQLAITDEINGGEALDFYYPVYPLDDEWSQDMKFRGWYKDSGLTTPFYYAEGIDGDIELYAKWEYSPTIYYYFDENQFNGSGNDNQILSFDSDNFNQRWKEAHGSFAYSFPDKCKTTINISISIFSEATISLSILGFDTTGSGAKNVATLIDNQKYIGDKTLPFSYTFDSSNYRAITILLNYSFANTTNSRVTMTTNKISVYPKLKINDSVSTSVSIDYGDSDYLFGTPYNETKTFIGWYTSPNGNGTKLTDNLGTAIIPWTFDDVKTVYAYFV